MSLLSMHRRACSSDDDHGAQAPMLGVLSVLLLLIPSLLLLAQVTHYAEITVWTPRFGAEGEPSSTIYCRGPIPLHVAIAHGTFFTRRGGDPWERVGASSSPYDHRALAREVLAYKRAHPHETVAIVTAQSDVPYETLVAALDTVRGPDCRLSSVGHGEDAPAECLLWQPVIQPMTPDAQVPDFRGGGTWPPRPRAAVTPHHASAPDRTAAD